MVRGKDSGRWYRILKREQKTACGRFSPCAFLFFFLFSLLLSAGLPFSITAEASETEQIRKSETVPEDESLLQKVMFGTVEQEGYSKRGEDGTVRGIDAEYLSKIAQYALLDIQYVFYDSFTDLLNALEEGQVDMALGISKTKEREERFLFSAREQAQSVFLIRVRVDDDRYDYGDLEAIQSMRLGASAGSVMVTKTLEWADENEIDIHISEYDTEESLKKALDEGEVDGVIVTGRLMENYREIFEFPSASYYAAFNLDQRDLKNSVDRAMSRIFDESSNFMETLENKYRQTPAAVLTLSHREKEYLSQRDRVSFIAAVWEDAPFCTVGQDGKISGILPDYYDLLSRMIDQVFPGASFSLKVYGSFEEAREAVLSGEADLLGITRIDSVAAYREGLIQTAPYSRQAIVRLQKSSSIPDLLMTGEQEGDFMLTEAMTGKQVLNAAVLREDEETLKSFLEENLVHYEMIPCDSLKACRGLLESGEADVILTSLFQATWLVNQYRSGSYSIYPFSDYVWPMSGAVARKDAILGEILSKCAAAASEGFSLISARGTDTEQDFRTQIQRLSTRSIVVFFLVLTLAIVGSSVALVVIVRGRYLQKRNQDVIRQQKERLYTAEHDSLTGLLNRKTAVERTIKSIEGMVSYTVFVVDLDNFHLINEAFGHLAGDQVLGEVAGRLRAFVQTREGYEILARYGGDEFLMVRQENQASSREEEIRALLTIFREPFSSGGLRDGSDYTPEALHLNVSIGTASGDMSSKAEEVIQNAAMALSEAKREGKNSVRAYAAKIRNEVSRYSVIQDYISESLENNGFYMVYQPQVDLKTRKIVGFEALIRMKKNGVSPGVFIPVAETSGYIRQIGRYTTNRVVQQLALWKDQGMNLHPVSINYSSNQIGDTGYVDYLMDLLRTAGISPSFVEIEITESLMLNQNNVTEDLFRRLQKEGIRILMDDFGTGYSSLSYLTYIPVDVIKIDKSMLDSSLVREEEGTAEAPGNKLGNAFISDIIRLAHDLGKKVIVEGVEERWQVEILRKYGCDMIQGYYYSKPLPAEEVPGFVLPDDCI